MKVLGAHTYMGGFLRGIHEAGHYVIGSVETWKEAMPFADILGIRRVDYDTTELQHADLVVGNPPCSRFSPMSYSTFNHNHREKLDEFCDLKFVLDVGLNSHARTIWWENGPIAFTQGVDMIQQAHDYVRANRTLVMKFSMLYTGALQNRTRTHVIHFLDGVTRVPKPAHDFVPIPAYAWVMRGLDELKIKPYIAESYYPMENPLATIQEVHRPDRPKMGFLSTKPRAINERAKIVPNVFGGRYYCWEGLNRWWSMNEYANAMCYPADFDWIDATQRPGHRVQTIMGKSVSPSVSSWIMRKMIEPALMANVPVNEAINMAEQEITYVRMTVPGVRTKDVVE